MAFYRATLFTLAATGAASFRPYTGDYGQFDMQVGEQVDPTKWNVVEVDHPGAHMAWDAEGFLTLLQGKTFLQSIEDGKRELIRQITITPGPFAFAAYSLGAAVAAAVYEEIRNGELQYRRNDFLGAVTFGSPVREAGHTIPGGTDPGGHGVYGADLRINGTEDLWWDFAQASPKDPYTTVGDDLAGQYETAMAMAVIGDYVGQGSFTTLLQTILADWPDDMKDQIPAMFQAFLNVTTNAGHGSYASTVYSGLPGNTTKTAIQLAVDHLNSIAPAVEVDVSEELDNIEEQVEEWRQELLWLRQAKPMITFYRNKEDGSPGLEYYGRVDYRDTIKASFPFKKNVSTQGVMELRFDHYISEWMRRIPNDPHERKNVVIRIDFFGGKLRWTGLLHHHAVKTRDGQRYMELTFNDDLQFLQFLLGPPNPALPIPVFQWPRVLPILGPAKWACSIMILINLMRKEGNAYTLPDDPFDLTQYFAGSPTQWHTWQCHIRANPLPLDDSSLWTVLGTRMNPIDSVLADALEDAQLTIKWRRCFSDEGEVEPGLMFVDTPANGALILEIEDDSGYYDQLTGTFLGGTIAQGMVRSVAQYVGGFIEDTAGTMLDDETLYPDAYYGPGWLQTLSEAPWLVIRDTSWSPIETSELTWSPATAVSVIVGGDNPAADAIARLIIETTGNMLGYFLLGGFSAAGSIAADVIMPFIVGTIAAWLEWKNTGRAQNLGWVHLWELYQQGAENNSWSLSALAALRGGFLASRSETSHTVSLNSSGWIIPGAHFEIGSRVGTTCRGYDDIIFVNQVEEIIISWDHSGNAPLNIQVKIGQNKAAMTVGERLARLVKKTQDIMQNIGVHLIS